MYTQPRGSSFLGFLVAFALGGFLGAGIACLAGWICGGNNNGGGGGAPVTITSTQCTSGPNACGLVSIGTNTYSCPPNLTLTGTQCQDADGNVTNATASCDATPPSNASCPSPTIDPVSGFSANPSTIAVNGTSKLTWTASNATTCTIKGDNGFSSSGTASGSVTTAPLTQSTTFTLSCSDGDGGPTTSRSIRVIVDPHFKEV